MCTTNLQPLCLRVYTESVEIRLILLEIVTNGWDNRRAIDFMRSKGFGELAAKDAFLRAGVIFPVKDFDELNPSPRRKEQLQELSVKM